MNLAPYPSSEPLKLIRELKEELRKKLEDMQKEKVPVTKCFCITNKDTGAFYGLPDRGLIFTFMKYEQADSLKTSYELGSEWCVAQFGMFPNE